MLATFIGMKIVIPGGSGQVGTVLARAFMKDGHDVTILSRGKPGEFNTVQWDGRTHDKWVSEIDEADVVINLAGRNVNCRYTAENRKEIMDSRVESARAVGEAIAIAKSPPAVWLQASTATIYSHRYDAPNDDIDGIIGGTEDDAPDTWKFSIDVARNWEKAANDVITPDTRKVMMRSAMTMSPDKEGIFDTLYGLVKMGLGGTAGNGKQFISWVHETDFINAVYFLIENEELDGPVNIAAPNPLPNSEFMRIFRRKAGMPFGLPASKWMLELGARLMNTETELILKSRRVVSRRLEDTGFEFEYPVWEDALKDLLSRRN